MPITHGAHKKLRQDEKRRSVNRLVLESVKDAVRTARTSPTPKNVSAAFSALDEAAKKNVLHENRASRLKSRLSKKITPKPNTTTGKSVK